MLLSGIFDPQLTEINRLASRPALEPDQGAWRKPLDGQWQFRLVGRPGDAPRRWHEPGTSDAKWRTIEVPGVWTRQDTGDFPHYTNIVMPWPGLEPPDVADPNPTGLYRTTFTVPPNWRARQVVVHLGAVESVAAVWCNGQFVGMGKDSRLPSEFDLSPFLETGNNLLAVMAIRYSDATWIEDQDHWWHGGIHRSCFLEARSPNRIDDLVVDGDFDPSSRRGELTVHARVAGSTATQVRVTLETERGRRIGPVHTAGVHRVDDSSDLAAALSSMTFDGPVAHVVVGSLEVRPWSDENPTRYRVTTELLAPGEEVLETHTNLVGFRRVEVRHRRLLVNGQPIVIHGVNRHDHHPANAKTLTLDEMRADLVLMKRHNINAVRTAHYPNDHQLLDLCDELGLYVIDEANVESHACQASLANDPRWAAAITERVRRMVLRDRSHPCIIGWSLGNESGHGPCHDSAAAWIRAIDPTRFVHYEGAIADRFGVGHRAGDAERICRPPSERERITTDVVCPMYSPVDDIVRWARWAERTEGDDRPLLMCEFSHAMGNSNGSIVDYVDAFHAEPALTGGFVWDWRDQGLAETDKHGRFYWAYGGHFGEQIHDANFCINGLVGPDLTPHPALREYMWAGRPAVVTHVRGRTIKVDNRRRFGDLSDLRLRWKLTSDSVVVARGELDVQVEAMSSRNVTLPAAAVAKGAGCYLDVEWVTRRRNGWAERGHVVGWDQMVLRDEQQAATRPANQLTAVVDDQGQISVVDERFGPLISGIDANLWRAPIDNDGAIGGWLAGLNSLRRSWTRWGLDDLTVEVDEVRRSRGRIQIERRLRGTDEAATHRTVVTHENGTVRFRETIETPAQWTDLARVGVRFEVTKDLIDLMWDGLGPLETYPDRCASATRGEWRSRITDQFHPYVVPQETAAHVETRSFELRRADGTGLIFVASGKPLIFSARPYNDHDLAAAATWAELPLDPRTQVTIDTAMRGLGTGICGPDTLPKYRLGPGRYSWEWTVMAT